MYYARVVNYVTYAWFSLLVIVLKSLTVKIFLRS